jgi:L-threonylcarbamoyladenylate synthase
MKLSSKKELDQVSLGVEALCKGNLVVFPTETVYGLGADALNPKAISRVYQIKNRPKKHPLIVHLVSDQYLKEWATHIPDYAFKLADDFWPGPLTLILEKNKAVKDFATGSQNKVALRVPNNPIAINLLREFSSRGGLGIAAPSVNRFGEVTATTIEVIRNEFAQLLSNGDIIIDGGQSQIGIESTIIDCTNESPVVLRPGWVTTEMIQNSIGLSLDKCSFKINTRHSGAFKSHYKPRAKVYLDVTPKEGYGFYALSKFQTPSGVIRLGAPKSIEDYAHNLYLALSEADRLNIDIVSIFSPQGNGLANAIRDRLNKASSK